MKASNKLLSVLTILAVLVFLTSCTAWTEWRIVRNSVGDVIKPTIKLKVDDGALQIVSQDKAQCNAGTGCISVGEWNIALITFKLTESDGWHFTKFEICKVDKKAEKGDKKANRVCSLDKWAQAEVFATDKKQVTSFEFPNEAGEIDLESIAPDLTRFYVFDYNAVEQEYFYSITACPSNGGQCLTTDPPIENDGRGWD